MHWKGFKFCCSYPSHVWQYEVQVSVLCPDDLQSHHGSLSRYPYLTTNPDLVTLGCPRAVLPLLLLTVTQLRQPWHWQCPCGNCRGCLFGLGRLMAPTTGVLWLLEWGIVPAGSSRKAAAAACGK